MPKPTPFLWLNGKVDQAARFYRSVFKETKVIRRHQSGRKVMSVTLRLNGQDLVLFDGGPHYQLTPAFSLLLECATQREIDTYWRKLTKGGEESRCGWLVDRFGVSWQIVPSVLGTLIGDDDEVKSGRAVQAMLGMRKLDIAALKRAHAGT